MLSQWAGNHFIGIIVRCGIWLPPDEPHADDQLLSAKPLMHVIGRSRHEAARVRRPRRLLARTRPDLRQ